LSTAYGSRQWRAALVATLLLILGGELFLSFSELSLVKFASYVAMIFGVLLFAVPRWDRHAVTWKLAGMVTVTGYWLIFALRYPGILKEAYPYRILDMAVLGAKVFLLLTGVTVGIAVVSHVLRSFVSRANG